MIEIQLIILGIIQGVTEFLPISSSAHLVLVSDFFGWSDQGLNHDIAVHVGTLGAVLFYFQKDLLLLLNDIIFSLFNNKSKQEFLYIKLIISTLPAILIGFLVYNYFIDSFRNIHLIAYSCIIFGILLYFSDQYSYSNKTFSEITFREALLIGIFQCFAFIPGASRSGVVITISRLLNLNRESAAIYSMLLSIPIILASLVLTISDLFATGSNLFSFREVLFSSLIAFITAFFSIKFIMLFIKKSSFNVFVVYRIILGLVILFWIYS